jgi:hypothetical protein
MSIESKNYQKFNHDNHARSCSEDDFLGQVRRTVRGVPVSLDQIDMISASINSGLELNQDDVLLELACGNGFVSQLLFNSCKGYLGIDQSEYLISVAKKKFEALPRYRFSLNNAIDYLDSETEPEKFTKVLCYAGFQYFPDRDALKILNILFNKFYNVQKIFIGNLPDKDRAHKFYTNIQPSSEELSDHETAIGVWRNKTRFKELVTGWNIAFSIMPDEFYCSHYRYDALLSR